MIANEVSQLLAQRALDVAQRLFPNGIKKGNEWCVGSVDGSKGNSLKIHLTGFKAGVWSDFETGQSGDLLDLWAAKHNITIGDAIRDVRSYFGMQPLPHLKSAKELGDSSRRTKSYSKPKNINFETLSVKSDGIIYLREERGLYESIEAFRVGEINGNIVFPYYENDSVVFVKHLSLERIDGKKKMWVDAGCKPILFGWQAVHALTRTITICEGEIDAMSLYEYGITALSVPLGGGSGAKHEWIENEFDKLAVFDKIYICMDNDEPGQLAAKEIAERLGYHRCHIVELPMKDANECLVNGLNPNDIQYFFNDAKTIDPDELKKASLYREQTWDKMNPKPGEFVGYELLWEYAKGKILLRPNELCIWTGINGHGKSQFLGQVMLQMIAQGAKICIASMELKPSMLLARMTRQATAMNQPSREYLNAAFDWYDDHLWLFDLVGTAKSKRLLEVFLYARQRYGIDVFVIDSFLTLDIAEDDYKGQKAFIEQLRDFKNNHNCQIHMVVHPRKPSDESQPPSKLDNKGTGAITDLADSCFCVWRHKDKELVIEKQKSGVLLNDKELEKLSMADCILRCDKQRHGDWEGILRFWFDKASLQYRDIEGTKPKPYFQWSGQCPINEATTPARR